MSDLVSPPFHAVSTDLMTTEPFNGKWELAFYIDPLSARLEETLERMKKLGVRFVAFDGMHKSDPDTIDRIAQIIRRARMQGGTALRRGSRAVFARSA